MLTSLFLTVRPIIFIIGLLGFLLLAFYPGLKGYAIDKHWSEAYWTGFATPIFIWIGLTISIQ